MYVWDVLLRCEVFCGSQQHGDLYTLPPCSRMGEGGRVWGGRARWKEGMKEAGHGHPCLFYFNLAEKRYSVFLFGPTRRNTDCPLFHSLVHFFHFLSFLSSAPLSFSCLSVTDSGKRVLALTPRAPPFVMKEEITVLICAYFASFWITHPQIILFTPHFFA